MDVMESLEIWWELNTPHESGLGTTRSRCNSDASAPTGQVARLNHCCSCHLLLIGVWSLEH